MRKPKPFDYSSGQVKCPNCDNEQADMGNNVACEECGEGPMPTADKLPAPQKPKGATKR